MLVRDMLGLALSAFRQQKTRTVLTTLGVVFGSLVLTTSLSVGLGVQRAIQTLTGEFLRQVQVWPDWNGTATEPTDKDEVQVQGKMSEARRERLRKALAIRKTRDANHQPIPLSQKNLASLAALDHVQLILPFVWQDGLAVFEGQTQPTEIGAARPDDAAWRKRLVAGRFFNTADEPAAVVNETLLYLFGVIDESSVDGALGKKLRLEFRQGPAGLGILVALKQQLLRRKTAETKPADTRRVYVREFTIVGVVRAATRDEERQWWGTLQDGDVVLPFQTAADLFFKRHGQSRPGVDRAVLIVDREENVDHVLGKVRQLGFSGFAPLEEIKRQRLIYLLIFSGQACVAIIALIVAGLGIANTMLISVLERTHEIGIMKAIGADNRHLQAVFLVEGALIGGLGGGLGLLLAWAVSFPGNVWVQSMVSRDLKIELKESIFAFPAWLPPAVLCFVVAITVLAAVYPSRRAARVDPVTALRHE